jgi:RimJ/RimL family protein N-acetyltransferase
VTAPAVLRTARLELVAATLDLVLAELSGRPVLSRLLRADVPDTWPPGEYDRDALEFFRARLAADPEAAGWYGWYAIAVGGDGTGRSLVAAAGFLGPPDTDGMVEIGYSVLPEERGKGHAAEIVQALVDRACRASAVRFIVAHAADANPASAAVLRRCGFRRTGPGEGPGSSRYERHRTPPPAVAVAESPADG